jgi:hypothetical protein
LGVECDEYFMTHWEMKKDLFVASFHRVPYASDFCSFNSPEKWLSGLFFAQQAIYLARRYIKMHI